MKHRNLHFYIKINNEENNDNPNIMINIIHFKSDTEELD